MPVLLRASLRYLARHPWQSWLSVIGIALGVAVVVAVDVANHSARTAFGLSVERIAGRATHQIEAAADGIPDALYAHLRLEQDLRPATPVVEGPVRIAGRSFTLLGLDPFAALPLRPAGESLGDAAAALPTLLTEPGALLLTAADAASLGVAVGDRLTLTAVGVDHPAVVAGLLPGDGAASEGLVVADIATAQELLGRVGRIDRIDLILDESRAAGLAAALPEGLRLVSAERRSQTLEQMTRAFHTNLTAMSLLAVLVGGFIIYNTMTFAVLRRRPLLGTLRTLGVTRGQLFALVLGEALVFAVVAAIIGAAAGVLVGWGLVQLVTRTINDLYFALTVSGLFVSPASLIKGVGLGILVTLAGAFGPALEAAASQPRDVLGRARMEARGRRLLPWLALAGLVLAGLGLLLAAAPLRSIAAAFTALFLVILGFSLCVPLVLGWTARGLAPLMGRLGGVEGRLAARGIDAAISRTGIAAAALTVAVAATVGVGIMVDSFRGSVADWLSHTLASDIYLTAPSTTEGGEGALPPGLFEAVRALPGVEAVSRGRGARVEARPGPVTLLALEPTTQSRRGLRFTGEGPADPWPRFEAGETIFISEPYAWHHELRAGDTLSLFTAEGWRDFEVGGVFVDYGTDRGMLVMARDLYARLWRDPEVSTLGVLLAPGADPQTAQAAARALAAGHDQAVMVVSNRSIREESLAIFDRTFVITRVLRMLAVGVAFVGVLSALMALQLERAREHAILRATGVTPGGILALILLQTSVIGLVAGLLAIPLGWVLGALLIHVVNVRSFGWTMEMAVPADALLLGIAIAWGAALLAGLYPALRAARTDPAGALRAE